MNQKTTFFPSACAVLLTTATFAAIAGSPPKDLIGLYTVVSGEAKSREIGAPIGENYEQLGTFKVKLERSGWDKLSKTDKKTIERYLIIEGPYRGKAVGLNEVGLPLIDHALITADRTSVLYTQNDNFVPNAIPTACGSDALVTIVGIERINVTQGLGRFQNLQKGTIFVNGILNQCSLQNDFTFIPKTSYLCFGEDQICPED